MKITVKHKATEVIVQDDDSRITNYNLIHYNQDYIIKLIKEISQEIIKMNNDQQ